MATVNISLEDNVEFAIRKFRKEVEKESILKELKDRQYYKKPSLIKREEKIKLEKRIKRKERKKSIYI